MRHQGSAIQGDDLNFMPVRSFFLLGWDPGIRKLQGNINNLNYI